MRRRAGGRWRLGGLLVLAAAAFVAWQSATEPGLDSPAQDSTSPALPAVVPATVSSPAATRAASARPESADQIPVLASAPGPARLIVLPTIHENPDQTAIDAVNAIRTVMLRVLRSLPDLEVVELTANEVAAAGIESSRAQSIRGLGVNLPGLGIIGAQDQAIARHFGSEFVLGITNAAVREGFDGSWVIQVRSRGPNGGGSYQYAESTPFGRVDASLEQRATRLAREVYANLFPDSALGVWESVIANTRVSEAERLEALEALRTDSRLSSANGLSADTVTAAVELARSSADPATRARIWQLLGEIVNPAAAQPLTDALLYDADPSVRMAAATALYSYLPDPTVEAALESVAMSAAPADVRLQAQWQLLSARERADLVDRSLRDASLSVDERFAALALYRRRYDHELASDLLGTMHELGLNSDDPRIRSLALRELGLSAELEYVDPLIEALGTDPDPDVRQAAMSALSEHRDGRPNPDPGVYNDPLIESLRRDPDPQVRMLAASWLRSAVELPDVRAAMSAALAAETDASVRAMIESVIEPRESMVLPILR